MKKVIAIPVWEGALATTFDFAEKILMVEMENACELRRYEVALTDNVSRSRVLEEARVDVMLCGTISQRIYRECIQRGIQVIPFVSGEIDAVLSAYLSGRLDHPCYMQPGCRMGARRRWRHKAGCRREVYINHKERRQ